MKRIVAVALVALFLACDTVPRHTLTLTFNDSGDRLTIASTTTLPSLKEARDRARVERLRDELLASRDEWALRFANAAPERDRVVFDRTGGELSEEHRSATIDAEYMQKFFYDLTITTKVKRGDGWVELEVCDVGPGVPDEFVARLFERFSRGPGAQRQAEGAGLGLSIVRSLAEAVGGEAWYEARHPAGACFGVRVPSDTASEPPDGTGRPRSA